MSTEYNSIQDNIRKNGVSGMTTEQLIFFLYYASKDPKLKTIDKTSIENYFYNINYSYYFENIFTNKGNYSQISLLIIGLLIPFYINYPRMYNLGFLGFLIGILSFILLYQFINNLYGSFFPYASKLFILITIIFYVCFFILLNKLNHISLFFISSIVSFCIVNYVFRFILTLPTDNNKYNKYNVTYEDKKDYISYDSNIEQVCNEVIKRFGLNLPSGKMLYSYLTVFKMGENNNKISDFLVNIFSPFITLLYNYYLGTFLSGLENKEYNSTKFVIPIIGISKSSLDYINCQANYVLPIEFNFNSFIHEYYQEKELDDNIYRIFLKCIKRINFELLDKYKPKFVKLDNVKPELLKKSLEKNSNERNHILVELEKFYKDKGILNKNQSLNELIMNNKGDYLNGLLDYINKSNIEEKDKKAALELYHKINCTLQVKVELFKDINMKDRGNKNKMVKNNKHKYPDDYSENIDLAMQVLLDHEEIEKENDDTKKLLRKLCENYVDYFRKFIKEDNLYGYNYNIWSFKYFDKESISNFSNKAFYFLMRLISVYVLFARPVTSPWMLTIFALIPKIKFENYFKYFNEDSFLMKYLSLGMDDEYFKDEYTKEIKNNTPSNVALKLFLKIIVYILVASPFLQFYNNTLYGLTFTPNYVNIIYQGIFFINLIGNFYCEELIGIEPMSFNIIFWIIFFIATLIIYFLKKK